MNLKAFKNHFLFKPEQTIVINRPFVLDGDQMHLLALTYENESYSLWTMDCLSKNSEDIAENYLSPPITYRDSYEKSPGTDIRSIESLEIGPYKFEFNGTSTHTFTHPGDKPYHRLQYFIDKGIELDYWDYEKLEKMQLTEHTSATFMDMVSLTYKNEAIKLKFRPYHKELKVAHKYRLDFDVKEPVKFTYFNPFENKNEDFYVHKFETYSFEDYKSSLENHERYNEIPTKHIENMLSVFKDYCDGLKANDSTLLLMTYEADLSLNFYLTEFLDRDILKSSTSSSMGFIVNPDEKTGSHGKRLHINTFHDAKTSKLDVIEFELLSVMKTYPECDVVINEI